MSCECRDGYFLTYNYGGWITCAACPLGQVGDCDDDHHYSVISILILFKVKTYLKEIGKDEKCTIFSLHLYLPLICILFWCSSLTVGFISMLGVPENVFDVKLLPDEIF